MIFEKLISKRTLKKESAYRSIQQELKSYRKLGVKEYIFLGNGCDICTKLNGKSFLVTDARVGVNLPPMHPNCKCTIIPKSKFNMFKDESGTNPLKDNPKFEEWKKKQAYKNTENI